MLHTFTYLILTNFVYWWIALIILLMDDILVLFMWTHSSMLFFVSYSIFERILNKHLEYILLRLLQIFRIFEQSRRTEHMRVGFCAEMEVKSYELAQPDGDFDNFFVNASIKLFNNIMDDNSFWTNINNNLR